jgi:hypothetical protein
VIRGLVLVVDPHHWLLEDGSLPTDNLRLRRRVLRIARLIEYGGPLRRGETRETLVECTKRPSGKQCIGLLWVVKTDGDEILGQCIACGGDQILIHGWKNTEWADGPMEAAPADLATDDARLH